MSFFDSLKRWFSTDEYPLEESLLPEKEIKELAVKLALSGNGLHLERKRIEDYYTRKEASLRIQAESEKAYFDEQIDRLRRDIEEQHRIKDSGVSKIEILDEAQKELRTQVAAQHIINDGAWQEILKQRYAQGKQFFISQSEKIASSMEQECDQIKNAINKQFDIEKEIYDIQLKNYEANKDELERRASKCEVEQSKIEKELETLNSRLQLLQTFGITRQSASFLLIVGILALAGAGSVVANLLQGRQPGDDLITWFVKSASDFISNLIPSGSPAWVILLKPIIFILVVCSFLLVFYALIIIIDKIVKRFDAGWGSESHESKTTESTRGSVRDKSRRKSFLNNLEDAINEQQGLKSYFNFIPLSIERRDYTRLIASFPYIFLVGAIIFLLSGRVNNSTFTLSTAYIGVIVVLLSASCCIIYATKVIEPRWVSYAARVAASINTQGGQTRDDIATEGREVKGGLSVSKDVPPHKATNFFWLHWEMSLLLILLVFSLALAALLPTKSLAGFGPILTYFDVDVFKHAVWGSLSIFVSLSSFGLAYGIIQHGLFREADTLEIKRQLMRSLTDKYRSKPVIGGTRYFQYDYPDDLILEQFKRLHELEDDKTWFEINEIFADDYEFVSPGEGPDALDHLSRVLLRRKRNILKYLRRKKSPMRELRSMDFTFAPEAASRYVESSATIAQAEARIRTKNREIEELRERISIADNKQKEMEEKLLEVTKQRNTSEANFLKAQGALDDSKERDLMIFTAAYTIGSVANKLIRDEGLLPYEIINLNGSPLTSDQSGEAPKLPAKALWLPRKMIVTVLSEERFEGRPHYTIEESESVVPESDLLFLPETTPSPNI